MKGTSKRELTTQAGRYWSDEKNIYGKISSACSEISEKENILYAYEFF